MAKMLRNTPNPWSSYDDTCRCLQCRRRGAVDAMVRRAQRARELRFWRREAAEDRDLVGGRLLR